MLTLPLWKATSAKPYKNLCKTGRGQPRPAFPFSQNYAIITWMAEPLEIHIFGERCMGKKWRSWLLLAAPYLLIVLLPVISVLFLGRTILTDYQEKIITDKQNSLLLAYHSHLARNGALRGTATALKLCTQLFL